MKFVDRIDEAARLKDALVREKSSLVVMYGRRRLGKSTLIKRVLSDNDVYFLADRSEGQHQRALLAKVIAQVFPDFDKLTYPDWESMFRAVNYRTDKHFTLCLDEFPYLVEQSSELPSCLLYTSQTVSVYPEITSVALCRNFSKRGIEGV